MRNLILAAIVLALSPHALADEKESTKNLDGITARLEFPPAKAGTPGVVRCIVKNGSAKEIQVPNFYDGTDICLWGMAFGQRGAVQLRNREAKTQEGKTATVKPGEELVICDLPMNEIFFEKLSEKVGESNKWRWDWQLRLAPPHTPFHSMRDAGLVPEAIFWCTIRFGDKSVMSPQRKLKLTVKTETTISPVEEK